MFLAVFLLSAVMVFGHVELYRLEQQMEADAETLTKLELSLGALRKEKQQLLLDPEKLAEEYDMHRPAPEEYIVVHVTP